MHTCLKKIFESFKILFLDIVSLKSISIRLRYLHRAFIVLITLGLKRNMKNIEKSPTWTSWKLVSDNWQIVKNIFVTLNKTTLLYYSLLPGSFKSNLNWFVGMEEVWLSAFDELGVKYCSGPVWNRITQVKKKLQWHYRK